MSSSRIDLHPRTLRSNIWRALLCASDLEIHEGMHFYEGAHGLCRMLAKIYSTSPSHVAGIYAALSPMNTWDTNVANIVKVLRWQTANPRLAKTNRCQCEFCKSRLSLLRVNTTSTNRDKALAISTGSDPLEVLKGRKVRAFYQAIANPSDLSPIPVDRHLICLAIGRKITSNQQLRSFAGNRDIYSRIEAAYQSLGAREGLGNRLASIAWFVQRRVNGSIPLFHPNSPVCCSRPMWSQGAKRFQCGICKRTKVRQRTVTRSAHSLPVEILTDFAIPREILSVNSKGRLIIYLGTNHKYARSGGVNYLARYIVESHLGHRLRTDEHVHHVNGVQSDCRLSNLEVWLAERHGRYHARTQLLYMFRDETGRFAPSQVPAYSEQLRDEVEFDLDSNLDLDPVDDVSYPSLSASFDQSEEVPF